MVEVLVSLGAVAYLGAWRLRWSFGLAQVFWWASIFAATDDPIIRYGWFSMMVLEIMTRNDFPHLRQIFTRPGWFIGSMIGSVIFNKGDRFQRYKKYSMWGFLYDDYQSQDVARARSDRKRKYMANMISQVIGVMLALYVGWLAYHMLPNEFQWFVFAAAFLFLNETWGCAKRNYNFERAIAEGLNEIDRLNSAERNQILHLTESFYFSSPRIRALHMGVLVCAGESSLAFICMSALLFLSAFEAPEYNELYRFEYQSLWRRNLKEIFMLRAELNSRTKLVPLSTAVAAYSFSVPVLFWWNELKQVWDGWTEWVFHGSGQKKGNFPQVVCISTGVDCHWNWLDEKELAELESRMNWAWLYHEYYLDKDENRPVGSILEKSDAAIVTIQLTPGEGSGRMLRNIQDYVQQPFRHLSVLQVRNENHLHSFDSYIEGSLEYYCSVIDEPIFDREETNLGELVELEPIHLNRRVKASFDEMGMDAYRFIYQGGIMELNILHRRVHEFGQPASRFLELLNIWELTARWTLVSESVDHVEQEREQLSLPFGKVFDLVRKAELMQQRLALPEQMMISIRQYWKEAFNWKEKMSSNPTVAEAFKWMIYIRNKTRGHGSTSRIHDGLYEAVEGLTVLLFAQINEHLNLELLVLDANAPGGVGTKRHGMHMDFLESEDSELALLPPSSGGVFFRQKDQHSTWRTSNLLQAVNGHVFILNDMKKGHREWVCFSTGELIRPEIIFDS